MAVGSTIAPAVAYIPIRVTVVTPSRVVVVNSGLVVVYHLCRIVMYNGLVHVAVGIEADIATIVSTLVGHKYFRMCIVEMTSCIARIDSECPVASRPDYRTIEVSQAHIPVELPAVQHEAEVCITTIPPVPKTSPCPFRLIR